MTNACPLIELVGGTRPNFMKLAPVLRAVEGRGRLQVRVVHTGQHYDPSMSGVFFQELGIRDPDVHLDVGRGTPASQVAKIIDRYASHLLEQRPDLVVVFGDVNSTVAAALAANKVGIPVAHVEAGLRSGDRSMPEEINRLVTDAIADLHLVSEPSGVSHLRAEGRGPAGVHLVGNTMIDSLMRHAAEARSRCRGRELGIGSDRFGLVTLHRPGNVDRRTDLERRLALLAQVATRLPLIFAVHPRTASAAASHGLSLEPGSIPGVHMVGPQSYLENLSLMCDATVVLTDSGGMQEECAALQTPCVVLRDSTERPVTLDVGACRLVAWDDRAALEGVSDALQGAWSPVATVPLWDGKAGERIEEVLSGALVGSGAAGGIPEA